MLAKLTGAVVTVLAGLALAGGLSAARAGDGDAALEGRWLTGKGGVAVTLFPCGEAYCGRIDWLENPRYRGGELRVDQHNPDPALRSRPWCGITSITGLKPDGDGAWTGGTFYYPKDGNNYDLDIETRGDGLKVYAYLGIRLLGKTETWTRAPDDLPGCTEG